MILPALLLIGLTAGITWQLAATPSARAESQQRRAPTVSPTNDLRSKRARIATRRAAVMAEVSRLVDSEVNPLPAGDDDALARYLSRLASRAQANGRVTTADVQPGVVAISRGEAGRGPEKTNALLEAFMTRMTTLSARLDGR